MQSNVDRYKQDLDKLLKRGEDLLLAIQYECFPEEVKKQLQQINEKDVVEKFLKDLPSFGKTYQHWYSESYAVIKQLLPDRLADFARLYERPKTRKEITYENYMIEDYLQGLHVTKGWEKQKVVGPDAAIPRFKQQQSILHSVEGRFGSSLFEIRQLVQADLFDSELDVARELASNKFGRAAGAMAGVVLEKHLAQVCDSHAVKVTKKNPAINDLNDLLKAADVIEVAPWRFIQHLADLRNLCDHNKKSEPTQDQVDDLIAGVAKVIKTIH